MAAELPGPSGPPLVQDLVSSPSKSPCPDASGSEEALPESPPGLQRAAKVPLAPSMLGCPVEVGEVLEASPALASPLPGPVALAPSPNSAAALAAAVLAARKSDPSVGGRLARRRRPHRPTAMSALPSCPSGGSIVQLTEASVPGLAPCISAASSSTSQCSESVVGLASSYCHADAGGCEGNARRPSYAEVVSSTPASQPDAGRQKDATMGWQDVTARCHQRRSVLPVPTMRRPLPAWLSGRCCRCLIPGHHAAACRAPIWCSCCLQSGHRMRECVDAWRPLSSATC
jgi:hypothetical protein